MPTTFNDAGGTHTVTAFDTITGGTGADTII